MNSKKHNNEFRDLCVNYYLPEDDNYSFNPNENKLMECPECKTEYYDKNQKYCEKCGFTLHKKIISESMPGINGFDICLEEDESELNQLVKKIADNLFERL